VVAPAARRRPRATTRCGRSSHGGRTTAEFRVSCCR
jgi:hypothetical protein